MALKDFTLLESLRKQLKAQEAAREQAKAKRLRHEKQARHDADLFRHSIGDVTPLAPTDKVLTPPPHPQPTTRIHDTNEYIAPHPSLSDEFSVDPLLDTGEDCGFVRPGIGLDILRKLQRGHWTAQRQLDLHGLRIDAARTALVDFLYQAQRHGLRCVKIILGNGLNCIDREPVLKNKVRNWLAQTDDVIGFCQAGAAEGGAGALIVLLHGSTIK